MIHALYVDDEIDPSISAGSSSRIPGISRLIPLNLRRQTRRYLKTTHDDVIVSDYQMPGINGIEFLTILRKGASPPPLHHLHRQGAEEIVSSKRLRRVQIFYLQKGGAPKAQFAELVHKIQIAVDHRKAEERVITLNRLYNVLATSNRAIAQMRDTKGLLAEICRILVRYRGVPDGMGRLSRTNPRAIVASSGYIEGYLDNIAISTEDVDRGRGPTGTAFRTGTAFYSNDVRNDTNMVPWRDSALERGYRAIAAVPFRGQSNTAGVITLCAPVEGFFDDDIVQSARGDGAGPLLCPVGN